MATKIKRDADNKWMCYIDWTDWKAEWQKSSPDGPGYTLTLDAVSWASPAAIIKEAETPAAPDSNNITTFVGSGGTNGVDYDLVATITYSVTELSATDMTQDQTITIRLEDQ